MEKDLTKIIVKDFKTPPMTAEEWLLTQPEAWRELETEAIYECLRRKWPLHTGNIQMVAREIEPERPLNAMAQDNVRRLQDAAYDGGGVVADAAGGVARTGDRSDIRVLAPQMAAPYGEHPDGSTRDRREAESERLVAAAKRNGLFIPENDLPKFGEKQSGRTGESEVYTNKADGVVVKSKNPYAKAPIKNNVPEDAIYEHLVHNALFPDTAYALEGISEHLGDVRIVLSQDFVQSVRRPSHERIGRYLAERLGLRKEDDYTYGNDYVSVTDVEGDNVLVDIDENLRFIDPLIKFKRPAVEVLDALPSR
ncbi:MAG: hypothetical protein J6K28_07470 [Alistipes sp.]|nr:hypothetical protein [Alistipes sp.]